MAAFTHIALYVLLVSLISCQSLFIKPSDKAGDIVDRVNENESTDRQEVAVEQLTRVKRCEPNCQSPQGAQFTYNPEYGQKTWMPNYTFPPSRTPPGRGQNRVQSMST